MPASDAVIATNQAGAAPSEAAFFAGASLSVYDS
jgi:hypothetical protein